MGIKAELSSSASPLAFIFYWNVRARQAEAFYALERQLTGTVSGVTDYSISH